MAYFLLQPAQFKQLDFNTVSDYIVQLPHETEHICYQKAHIEKWIKRFDPFDFFGDDQFYDFVIKIQSQLYTVKGWPMGKEKWMGWVGLLGK